ncbi:centrosomal protein of 131 kDa [Oryzias melastigma]|uniref:centrosomal protein of 131 kDa n=1 Tax=Oryzias melastigma TaxID=30732 RepID=UPI000CF7E772|nr:centrosomal protein of 131 kDa [Oryzias melastigma]
MHTTRSPSSIPKGCPEALDLSLSGSQLSVSKRPSSASPGKCFSRSISVSVAGDSRTKRNALSDAHLGSSRSIKNLRRSNSTTQVNQQAKLSLSPDQTDDYLALFDSSSDGRKKLASLSKTERTTWNILDDQPRTFAQHSSSHSTGSMELPTSLKKKEPGVPLAASFTANNRSNKGTVGNSVTTILHNNYSEKPLTPKSSNQKPSFNNLLKATANDEVSLENSSVTKSQKNFSFSSSASNNRSSVSGHCSPPSPRCREATEEEAERFIQQVNQAAVTIQCWYRRHAKRKHSNKAALKLFLANKRKEWQEKRPEDSLQEQQQRKLEDRKRIREEKARLARLAAIQELQQKRVQLSEDAQHAPEVELENVIPAGTMGWKKPARSSSSHETPVLQSNSAMSPADSKSTNTDSNMLAELSFRAISPATSSQRGFVCSQQEERAEGDVAQEQNEKLICKENSELSRLHAAQGVPQRRPLPVSAAARGCKKQLQMSSTKKSSVSVSPSLSNNSLMSPTKSPADGGDVDFRAASPALSYPGVFQCSQDVLQRSVSMEDQHQASSRPPSKTTLNELLDTLKLLEEEPQRLPKSYHKEKYAWINEDADSNSLTTDNLERHGQMNNHASLPDGGALLSEAKLQSIMSFLDEMEKSEQERPRSITSGSHREALLSEDELVGVEHASATAAEVTGSVMRLKMELEEKKCSVSMLQTALAQQRELTTRHVKETERELSRSLQLQKEQYEATIQRHLAFIDQLISDKKALSERCEGVLTELKQVDLKYTKKIAQMQQQHEMVWQILGPLCEEIKKLKDLMSASEKIRREKWIDEKTKKIKEITVKGLEPEIQKLISKHKQELKKLRALHEAELLQADERAAQHYVCQCEELRLQLEKEKEEHCQRERDLAKQRYEKQLQEEEFSLQQQRRRLYKEVSDDKDRLAQLAARQRTELEDLRRQLEENSSLAERALREELDKTKGEQERRHQMEMKVLQEQLDMEKNTWEESYRKKEEARMLSREREMKEELRRERDKEIELAIWTLEEETSKDKEECERAADNRVKRLRAKYEAELRELESSERAAVDKQQEWRKKQMEMEEELIHLQTLFRQKEIEMEEIKQTRDKLAEERCNLSEVIRQEFAERLVATEEENRRLKVEVSEARAGLRLEVEKINQEKEEELAEVHQRVKSAILKKEESVNNRRRQYEAALKRADHLESLWEQQRKQLLEK